MAFGGLCGLKGSVMVPEGGDFLLSQVLAPKSMFARLADDSDAMLRVNSFDVRCAAPGPWTLEPLGLACACSAALT